MTPDMNADRRQKTPEPEVQGGNRYPDTSQSRMGLLLQDLKSLEELCKDPKWGSAKGLIGAMIKSGTSLPNAAPELHQELEKLLESLTANLASLVASNELSSVDRFRLIRKTVFDTSFLASLSVHTKNWRGDNPDAEPIKILENALWNLYPKDTESVVEKLDEADGDRVRECKKLVEELSKQLDPSYEYEPNAPSDFSLRSMLEYMDFTLESLRFPQGSPERSLAVTWDSERLQAYKDLRFIEQVLKGQHLPPVQTAMQASQPERPVPNRDSSQDSPPPESKPKGGVSLPQASITDGIEGIESIGEKPDKRSVMIRSGNTSRDLSKMSPQMRERFEREESKAKGREERIKGAGLKTDKELRTLPGQRRAAEQRAARAKKKPGS